MFGSEPVLQRGHSAKGRRTRRGLALVAGCALALCGGAVTAAPALAMQEHVQCSITIYNYSAWDLQLTGGYANGSGGSRPGLIPAGQVATMNADSWFPVHNHCSIDTQWQLKTPDGTGWSQGMEAYVYNPNSGHNNAWASQSGDFAARNGADGNQIFGVTDENSFEGLEVDVCGPTCPPPYSRRTTAAFRSLRAGTSAAARLGSASATPLTVNAPTPEPKQVPSLLRRGDLAGSGWKRVSRITDLGPLGSVLKTTKAPASCSDASKATEPWPLKTGLSAFARRRGAEFIGTGHSTYANSRQARRAIDDALSAHSLRCLARQLTSKQTTVSTTRVKVTRAGRTLIFNRLKVATHAGGRITRRDYVDLTGVLHGASNALVMFASDKGRPDTRTEAAAISTVVRRLT